jgi:hypothetical protein
MAATATSIRAPDDGQTVAFTQHFTSGPPSALVLKVRQTFISFQFHFIDFSKNNITTTTT